MKITPDALLRRPHLPDYLRPWLTIFYTLSGDRKLFDSGGVGPIPLSSMLAYFTIYGIDRVEDRDNFIKMIRALDEAYMENALKKIKQ